MMDLTHKERLRRAICREPVDRLPTQIGYTRAMGAILASHLGVSVDELPARLDNHLVRVDLSYTRAGRPGSGGALRLVGRRVTTPAKKAITSRSTHWRNTPTWRPTPGPTRMRRGCWTRPPKPFRSMAVNISSSPTWVSPCSSGPGRCAGWSAS